MRWNVGGKRERRKAEKGTAGEGICERERVSEMVVEGWGMGGNGFSAAGGGNYSKEEGKSATEAGRVRVIRTVGRWTEDGGWGCSTLSTEWEGGLSNRPGWILSRLVLSW